MLLMGLTISSQPKNCFHLRLLGVDKIVAFGLSEHIIDSLIRVGTKRRAHPTTETPLIYDLPEPIIDSQFQGCPFCDL